MESSRPYTNSAHWWLLPAAACRTGLTHIHTHTHTHTHESERASEGAFRRRRKPSSLTCDAKTPQLPAVLTRTCSFSERSSSRVLENSLCSGAVGMISSPPPLCAVAVEKTGHDLSSRDAVTVLALGCELDGRREPGTLREVHVPQEPSFGRLVYAPLQQLVPLQRLVCTLFSPVHRDKTSLAPSLDPCDSTESSLKPWVGTQPDRS
mmetsp:Transcript_17750/g.58068  ORF Transcript_17750/g.58068 Transcript_17750/m.58068 type:complete len:207 (-) Transcript_17750:114-734(-)